MKKGLLAVLLLGFSVIAAQAHNAGLAKVSVNTDLTKRIESSVQRAALKAEMGSDFSIPTESKVKNIGVKSNLALFLSQHANDALTSHLKKIVQVFDELTGEEDVYLHDFVNKMNTLEAQVKEVLQKDKTFAEKSLLPTLRQGSYYYRYEKYLFDYVFSRYNVMTWDEAVNVGIMNDVRMMHSM